MNLKEAQFQKNGKNGTTLEILVNGERKEKITILPNMMEPPTHVMIKGSSLYPDDVRIKLNEPGNYRHIIQKIKRNAEIMYNSKYRFSKKPKIEIIVQ